VEVRRVMIVGVHANADGTQAVQSRHTDLSIDIVQLLHLWTDKSRELDLSGSAEF
jgi:hypothetical protein